MDNGRTYQQRLVFERLEHNLSSVVKFNDDLDRRATLITGASSIVVGIVAAAKFLPDNASTFSMESILLAAVCACSVLMYWHAIEVWRTSKKAMPGTTDPTELYKSYIARTQDEAFNNALIDLCYAVSECIAENERKAIRVEKIAHVFQWQIAVLGLAIGWSGVYSLFVSGS